MPRPFSTITTWITPGSWLTAYRKRCIVSSNQRITFPLARAGRLEEVNELIRSLPAEDFLEAVKRSPLVHQDAYRLSRCLDVPLPRIVQLRCSDISERGVRFKSSQVKWPDEEPSLKARLLDYTSGAEPEERLFEPHKPVIKATHDLTQGFISSLELWRQQP